MDVKVSGRRTSISDQLRFQAQEKIGRLDRYLGGLDSAEVHFWEEHIAARDKREFCEVTLKGHGHHIRTKVSAPDGFTAIDLAVDKLERQLRKLKTKMNAKTRSKSKAEPRPASAAVTIDELAVEYDIVRDKKFNLEPMAPQEAALQMDLLNHSFYMFENKELGCPAVVYRRDDGDIGLINTISDMS